MHVYCRNFAFRILALLLSQAACSPLLHAENLKPEDLVVRHLNSIGAAEARAASKSRVIQGTSEFVPLVGGSGRVQGTSGFVSEQRKVDILMKLGNSDYRGSSSSQMATRFMLQQVFPITGGLLLGSSCTARTRL
jgi:hypothetical protein